MRRLFAAGLWLSALLAAAPCAAGPKTDVVVLRSGDRITCEIKTLQHGYLEVDTDALGTLSVIWSDVGELTSVHHFVVEDQVGGQFVGTLRSPARGQLEVVGATTSPLDMMTVVAIRADRENLLARIDGSVQLSFNLAQANSQRQWALNADGQYSGRAWFDAVTLASSFTSQEGVEDTSRNQFNLQSGKYLPKRWFYAGVGLLQQDDELGLKLRVAGGGGVGRKVFQSNRRTLELLGGLLVTNERFQDIEGSQTNVESFLYTRYDAFRRHSPKVDVFVSFGLLPSLTESGRVRGEFQLSSSIEVIHNFFLGLVAFDSFDSKPPNAGLPNNDYGITPSLRWKF